jgi:hypothetical protein
MSSYTIFGIDPSPFVSPSIFIDPSDGYIRRREAGDFSFQGVLFACLVSLAVSYTGVIAIKINKETRDFTCRNSVFYSNLF